MTNSDPIARTPFLYLTAAVALLAACSQQISQPAADSGQVRKTSTVADPAVYRGSATARQVCTQCHDTGMGSPPIADVGAPSFASVANRPDMTSEKLTQWLASS